MTEIILPQVIPDGRARDSGGTTVYSLPGVEASNLGTFTLTADRIFYYPIRVVTPIALDQLAIEVTTSVASGSVRLGVYTATASLQPSVLVVDAGAVDASTTGVKTTSISVTLPPGLYVFCALGNSSSIALRSLRAGARYVGLLAALGSAPYVSTLRGTLVFGALPSSPTLYDALVASGGVPTHYCVVCRISVP